MSKLVRSVAAAAAALVFGFALPVLVSSSTAWITGDVFVGVGLMGVRPGEYLVRTSSGAAKETVIDPLVRRGGVTTGCAIGTDGALYATTFFNRNLTRFDPGGAHTATPINVPASVTVNGTTWTVEATESIAFHPDGTYYVGALPPSRNSGSDPVPPYGFIFKFSADDQVLATYAVPNEERGADWIDLTVGPGGELGLYYTSEGDFIHHVRPNPAATGVQVLQEAPGWPKRFTGIGGRLYGVRALPLLPDGRPSGFLVAHTSGAFRAVEAGTEIKIIQAYPVPPHLPSAHFFALNITPDGQSFWTATFQADVDPKLPRAGRLFRYHVATGDLLTLVDTGADNVWGLCVKREYTAAGNVCHVDNGDGTYGPATVECRPIEVCGNGTDEDGDNLADRADPDCASRTRPAFTPVDQASVEGQVVSLQLEAVDPNGDPLTYRLRAGTTLPDGLTMTSGGLITGTLTANSAGKHWITALVSDGVYDVEAGFWWTVSENGTADPNVPPVCDAARPTQATWPPNHKWVPVAITGVTDVDGDALTITVTGISQDEPVNDRGDGATAPDGRIDGTGAAWILTERTGVPSQGDGRIYEIQFTASDGKGGTCSGSVLVGVPHDRGNRAVALDSGRRWNSITGAVIR